MQALCIWIVGDGAGYEFVPLTFEAFDWIGNDPKARFLSSLGDEFASDGCASMPDFLRTVLQEPSCAMCMGCTYV